MYINVLTQIGAKAVDQNYIYSVPKELISKIKVGIRVKISFGKMILEGFVTKINPDINYDKTKIKDILDIVDDTPVLNKEMLLLGKDMSNKLLCSLVSAYQVMLPKALKAEINTNIKIKYNKYLKRLKSIEEIDEYIKNCKYESQINILCKLKEGDILITKMTSSINTIIKYGFAKIVMEEEKRYNYTGSHNYKKVELTDKQKEELHKLYDAKIVRMDVDTTSKKGQHEKIIEDFGSHKYDILIGTQMIAKGLDFSLVTFVGVVSADSSLMVPDFRVGENTFQLLSQVSGRAGRSTSPGEVIIQTYNKEHYSIELSSRHDYISFYKEEMQMRKILKYLPYYYMTLISITSKDYNIGFEESGKIGNYLKSKLNLSTIILGPTTASMFKINNIYYYQIILKYQKDNNLYDTLKFIDSMYKNNSKVKVEFDFDPIRI